MNQHYQNQTNQDIQGQLNAIYKALWSAKEEFEYLNKESGKHVQFKDEASWIYQAIQNTSGFVSGAMVNTPIESIVDSFLCIAKTGLTIDPKKQLAHIKSVFNETTNQFETVFDFGYRGYLSLIARSGEVKVITADVIYSNDTFEFNGTRELVKHQVKSLSSAKRGQFDGGYCSSQLIDNTVVTTVMSPEEINIIEENAKRYSDSAWNTVFIDELRRKTLIRRHWKTLQTIVNATKDNKVLSTVNEVHKEQGLVNEYGDELSFNATQNNNLQSVY